jgi:hypothetical protein
MKLSLLSILLGAVMAAPQVYGLTNPTGFSAMMRKFPRHVPLGVVLMLAATTWFVWNVHVEPIADFARFKNHMLVGFAAIGIGTCVFVRDYLAARGLAVLLLLVAKLMVDTGRPHLGETSWVLLIQSWAYVLVIGGIWFTLAPWRMRDLIEWSTASPRRIRISCGIRLAFALLAVALGLSVFRNL